MSTQTAASFTSALASRVRRTAPPALVRAGRSRALRTAALICVAVLSGVLLAVQLGSVDLVGTVASAHLGWLAVAVAASLVPFVGAALSLAAFAPGRLPLRRAIAVQVASSFTSVVLPPTVGQLAVNAQFLRRLGHGTAAAAATVALTQASSLIALALLAAALAATSATLTPALSTVTTAVLIGLAVAGCLLMAVPRVRHWLVARAAAAVSEVAARLRETVRQPARLAAGLAGSMLVTAGYVVALDACLRAVGSTLPLAQTAMVVLAGTALGSAAPTPGGAVVVEASLTGGLIAAGLPPAAALPAVLLYRAATVWLRVLPGWIVLTVLRRRSVL